MKITTEQEMLDFGAEFAKNLANSAATIELIGDVGAGKTTFVRGLAKGLEIDTEVTSPSFTISKSYPLKSGRNLVHYDFYRLEDPGLMRENLAEAVAEKNLVVVEWGESVKNLLPENHFVILIRLADDGTREVEIKQTKTKGSEGDTVCPAGSSSQTTLAKSSCLPKHTVSPSESSSLELCLDTSSPVTILKLNDKTYEWHSGRELAEKIFEFIREKLDENGKTWREITKITYFSGPGSFTGLRIGAAVVNTLSHELSIPLYDHKGKQHKIILPDYGRPARISKPKK